MTIVVSKMGDHCLGPKRDGWKPYLQTLHDAGRRVAVVDCHDDYGAAFEAMQIDPETLTIGDLTQFEDSFDINLLRKVSAANPHIKYWQVFNEMGNWSVQADQLISIMQMYGSEFKFVIFNCASGEPPYPEQDNGAAYAAVARACVIAKAGGHLLGLHEYGTIGSTDTLTRYRRLADYLRAHDALCDIVITEAGPDEGTFIGVDPFVSWCKAYDAELMQDDYILGVARWTLGGGGWQAVNYEAALPALATYQATVEPITPPPPVVESHDGAFAALSELNDQAGHVWALGGVHNPDAGYPVLKDGLPFAGGQAEALLYSGGLIYATNTKAEWYRASDVEWVKVNGDPRGSVTPPPSNTPAVGVFVSHYQNGIDWLRVKAAPTDYAFIKSSEGTTGIDPAFAVNWSGAKAQNILRGAVHYYRFAFDGVQQANHFLNVLGNDLGDLPLVADVEDATVAANANALKLFLDRLELATGRKPIIYTGAWWWTASRWGGAVPSWSHDYDLWIADYVHTLPTLPSNWSTYKFWQFSNDGIVPGITGAVCHDIFNGTLDDLKAYAATKPVPPVNPDAWRGLHMRADGHSADADYTALRVAKLNAAKIMTNTGFDELQRLITEGISPARIMLRLFAAGDNPSLKNSQQFFDEQSAWLAEFSQRGGKYVEVHNEPNHPSEGMGTAWKSAFAFGGWFEGVARLIRSTFPSLLIGWPGLWPDAASSPDFITALKASLSIGLVDWIGAHSYWANAAGVDDPENGRWYRRLLGLGRPVIVTEFSNNQTNDSDVTKGQQYKHYYATLDQGVIGAFAFVSSASDPTFSTRRETWVRNGALTDIPAEVGK